jgi:hypothetical protein
MPLNTRSDVDDLILGNLRNVYGDPKINWSSTLVDPPPDGLGLDDFGHLCDQLNDLIASQGHPSPGLKAMDIGYFTSVGSVVFLVCSRLGIRS